VVLWAVRQWPVHTALKADTWTVLPRGRCCFTIYVLRINKYGFTYVAVWSRLLLVSREPDLSRHRAVELADARADHSESTAIAGRSAHICAGTWGETCKGRDQTA